MKGVTDSIKERERERERESEREKERREIESEREKERERERETYKYSIWYLEISYEQTTRYTDDLTILMVQKK